MRIWITILCICGVIACDDKGNQVKACGDGVVAEGEACDPGATLTVTCESLGYHGGAPACAADCTLDLSECEAAGRCGDGEVDTPAEDCEGPNLNGQSCQGLGFTGGALSCGDDCVFDVSACVSICGNGVTEPDETCDDGGTDDLDGCSATCQVETGWSCEGTPSVCGTVCGDGLIIAGPEECDGDDLDGQSCEGSGYYGGVLVCDAGCLLDWSSCEAAGRCGDGLVQAPQEECDGLEAGETCLTLGFFGGDLVCDDCVREGCLGLTAVDGGFYHTCALDHQGNAWCWGSDIEGQLGNGTGISTTPLPSAVVMPAGVRFASLEPGKEQFTCALDTAGNAWCWGDNNFGQAGDGTTMDRIAPVAVVMPSGRSFSSLGCGYHHACALDTTGNVWCWGRGTYGQLGRGNTDSSLSPVAVTMPPGVTFASITAGTNHTCGLTVTGVPYCWGMNTQGQVGDGTTTDRWVPTLVTLPLNVRFSAVDAAGYSNMALDLVGNLYTWGTYALARSGGSMYQPGLAQMPTGVTFASVRGGEFHACALDPSGAAWCWGECSAEGECGTSGGTGLIKPVAMPAATTFTGLGLGARHSCGFNAQGALWCWGRNNYGQIGDGTTVSRTTPVRTSWP
jgi:cysteine-rich repeat protein